MKKIADAIKNALQQRGWTVYRLGKESGISEVMCGRIVKGKNVGIDFIERVLDTLDLEINITSK